MFLAGIAECEVGECISEGPWAVGSLGGNMSLSSAVKESLKAG